MNVDGNLSDDFSACSGVMQGSVLSPLLFTIVVDFLMTRAIDMHPDGLKWTEAKRLADLEYADDIVLLSQRREEMQSMMNRLASIGKKIGLKINVQKTRSHAYDGSMHRRCIFR